MSVAYNRGKQLIASAGFTTAADFRVLVLAGASVPAGAEDPDLNFVSDLLAVSGVVEAAAAGYSRQALTGEAVIEDDTNNVVNLDADNPTWASVATGETWRAAVVYKEGASDAARALLSLHTLSAALPTNGSAITLTVDTAGLIGIA